MITKLVVASGLVAITVAIHASGLGMVLSHVLDSRVQPLLANYMATDSHRLVAYRDSPGCDRRVGHILLGGEMSAGHGVVVLLFGGYLRHHWVRRSRLAERVADAWPNRGIHRHSNVRTLHGIFLCRREQKRSSTRRRKEPGLTG